MSIIHYVHARVHNNLPDAFLILLEYEPRVLYPSLTFIFSITRIFHEFPVSIVCFIDDSSLLPSHKDVYPIFEEVFNEMAKKKKPKTN